MIRRDFVDSKKKITSFEINNKAFYRYVKSQQQVKPKIQQLKKDDGGLTVNDEHAANELSEFLGQCLPRKGDVPEMEGDVINRPTARLDHLEIAVDNVCVRLITIKADKSPGPDPTNPEFLKALAECRMAPMTKIYKKSLHERRPPRGWIAANISPVGKLPILAQLESCQY